MKHLIIGGSDAGISAALRIKELDKSSEVHVFLADEYPNYSICGIPYYLSGEITDWKSLAHRSLNELTNAKIQVNVKHFVSKVDAQNKTIKVKGKTYPFDKLLLASGAKPVIPPIVGISQPGVFMVRWIGDMLKIDNYLKKHNVRKVIIIGGGYLGLEMADALTHRRLKVSIVELQYQLMSTFDESIIKPLHQHIEQKGVKTHTGISVEEIQLQKSRLYLTGTKKFRQYADLVIVAVGAQPENKLTKELNIKNGISGAIETNDRMETSIPDIYAAGDCIETFHPLLGEPAYIPLGTNAQKTGRIAGANMAGQRIKFKGFLGSQVVKVFDLALGKTGLSDTECQRYGLPPFTVELVCYNHHSYYPGAHPMQIRLTANRNDKQIYGIQIIGHKNSEISKRIDIIATAIYNQNKVDDLINLDLTYAPPFSTPWDPIQLVAQEWLFLWKKKKMNQP